MDDDGNTHWNPTQSITVPIFYFILAGVALLTWLLGWWVLAVFVALWAAAWLFAWFDDRRHAHDRYPESPVSGQPADGDSEAQGNCLKCGGSLFHVEPGKTTMQEIIAFASAADGWRDNPEALAGWMPPGVYCSKGCVAIHVTPIPPATVGTGNRDLAEKLGKFEDLLALAERVGRSDDVYAKQKSFVAYYRRGRRRFIATMLLRHRWQCEICKKQIGEAELHIEDPGQSLGGATPGLDWGEPAGRFYATQRSKLHGILVHGDSVPDELTALCDGVKD